jgi:hypothetical protein
MVCSGVKFKAARAKFGQGVDGLRSGGIALYASITRGAIA